MTAAEDLRRRPDFDRLLGESGRTYLAACRTRDDGVRRRTRLLQVVAFGGLVALAVVMTWLAYDARQSERRLIEATIFEQPNTNLSWTKRDNGTDIEWAPADRYCTDLEVLGRRGWRLPTVSELRRVYAGSEKKLQRTGDYIWSADRTELGYVFFEFNTGREAFAPPDFSNFTRAFCVSARGGTGRR